MQYRYEQIAGILENKIRNGEWQIGQKILGELALAGDLRLKIKYMGKSRNICGFTEKLI